MLMCFANCISPQFAPGQPGVGRGSGCLQLEPPEVAGSSEPGGGGGSLHPPADQPSADLVDSAFVMNESCASEKACEKSEPRFWGHMDLGWISTAAVY